MNGGRNEPASPCVGVCKLDPPSGFCQGCRRTLDEIARWTSFSTAEKQAVLKQLHKRPPWPEENNRAP